MRAKACNSQVGSDDSACGRVDDGEEEADDDGAVGEESEGDERVSGTKAFPEDEANDEDSADGEERNRVGCMAE